MWLDAPCMTTIDRSTGEALHPLSYTIPFEDPAPEDNPLDAHALQFFAFCRDHYREDVQPNWIRLDELEAAVDLGLGSLTEVDFERDILDTAARWEDCFARITADDARRPLTFEAAMEPVVWDTSELAAGIYVVEAYTWDPWFNLWSKYPGVFRIVDDPDPDAIPPAAALTFREQSILVGEEATVSGCVEALPGSTMRLSWAAGGQGFEPEWQEFSGELPAESGTFEVPFEGPAEAAGRYLLFRLELRDPLERSWTAYSANYIGVKAMPPPPPEPSEEGTSSSEGPDADEDSGGCNVSTAPGSGRAGVLALLLLAGTTGRRRLGRRDAQA